MAWTVVAAAVLPASWPVWKDDRTGGDDEPVDSRDRLLAGYPLNPERERLRHEHRQNALRCLGEAVEMGFNDLDLLKYDEDLDSLRALPEIQVLIESLVKPLPSTGPL
jgi:hypothetical protein